MEENRVSLLSVAAALWHWCLGLTTLMQIGWTAYIAWVHATFGVYLNTHFTVVASVKDSAGLVPLNIVISVACVAIADYVAKGGIMNTAEYVQKKFFEPSLRKHRKKMRAAARAAALAELGVEEPKATRVMMRLELRDELRDEMREAMRAEVRAEMRDELRAELGLDEREVPEAKTRANGRADTPPVNSEREVEYAKIRAETRADTLAEALRIALSGAGAETASDALSEALETHAKWANWNARRMEAEAQGIPFNEPPPSLDDRRRAL